MYADDSKIIAESELNKDNGLQEDLNGVVEWCETWSMILNAKLCTVARITQKELIGLGIHH